MKRKLIICAAGALFALAGCKATVDLEAERAALLRTDREWSAANAGEDLEHLFSFWTDDTIIYFPEAPPVVGKEEIRRFVQQNRTLPGFSIRWEPIKAVVAASGDLGYTLGTFEIAVNNPQGNRVTRQGNYVVLWEKQADGSWKCVVEVSNFNAPAAGTPPGQK